MAVCGRVVSMDERRTVLRPASRESHTGALCRSPRTHRIPRTRVGDPAGVYGGESPGARLWLVRVLQIVVVVVAARECDSADGPPAPERRSRPTEPRRAAVEPVFPPNGRGSGPRHFWSAVPQLARRGASTVCSTVNRLRVSALRVDWAADPTSGTMAAQGEPRSGSAFTTPTRRGGRWSRLSARRRD
jgi:hypothetical protein